MLEGIIVFLGVMLDQLTKLWVSGSLQPVGMIEAIPGVLNFRYVENTGMAFGLFGNGTLVLTITSAVLSVILAIGIIKYRKKYPRFVMICVAMILSGAIGNFIDRAFAGYVVDFIEFAFVNFAVFNVADIFVTVGTAMLAVYLLFFMKGENHGLRAETAEVGEKEAGPGVEAGEAGAETEQAAGAAEKGEQHVGRPGQEKEKADS